MADLSQIRIDNTTYDIKDATARSSIASEITARQNADTSLSNQISSEVTARQNADTSLSNQISALQGAVGSPLKASTVSAMADTTKIYVYTGSESGYTNGNWYYYNGSAWVSGGVYNSVAVETDTTLSVSGMPADAKATGRVRADTVVESDILELGYNGALTDVTSTLASNNIVGQQYLFPKGFVKQIDLNCASATDDGAMVILCDENMKVLFKASKLITSNDQTIPVNQYIKRPFYVLVSCKNIKYINNNDVYSTVWMGVNFTTYGGVDVGDTFAGTWNNNGRIGFGIQVVYNSVATITNDDNQAINDIPKIASYDNRVLYYIDDNNIVNSTKSSTATISGCYPCFFDVTEKMRIKLLSDTTWIIIAKDASNNFVALGFQGTGIIFASFNANGTVNAVDWNSGYVVENWTNNDISLIWEDDYFLSIYRNGNFFWKLDIRHTSTTIVTHQFGVGMYSNQSAGERIKLLPFEETKGIMLNSVNVLGDSFTDNTRDALGTGTFYFTRWYEFARTICNIDTVNNYGFGGTCMSPYVSGDDSFYNRMQQMTLHESAVFVLGGTNDYHFDVPLGAIDDDTTDTFYGTLNKMCEYLKDYYYDSVVVFCTPIMRVSPAQNKTETYPANNQTNNNGNTLEEFANAMIKVCAKWSIPCFDAYHNSGVCPQRRNTQNYARFMNDGLHPNQYGHRQLGMRFGCFAKQFI